MHFSCISCPLPGVEIVGVMIEANDDKHADGVVAINASFLVDRSSISVGGTNVLSKTEYGDSSRSFFGLTQVVLSKGDGLQMLVTDGILANVSTWDVSMKSKSTRVRIERGVVFLCLLTVNLQLYGA